MRVLTRSLVGLLAILLLASCGGGGGSGNNTPFEPAGLVVTVSPQASNTTPNSLVGVTVQARNPNGQAVADGTEVRLAVSPPGVGLVSNTTSFTLADQVVGTASGGVATFRFHSRSLGTATLTASVTQPGVTRTVTASANITVGAGPPSDPRLSISCVSNTVPVNILNLDPFIGSPYLTECTVTWRNLDGTLVGTGGTVQVSINPVNPTGGFTTLDDPGTTEDEFITRIGQGPVNVVAGKATFFFNSFNLPATAVITVTAIDGQTSETLATQQTITIVSGAPSVPASIGLSYNGAPVYVQGAGGNTSALIEALVVDGAGVPVPNPPAGVNNVLCEIVGGAQGGERLAGVNASGAPVSGTSISIRTNNGIANFVYQSGTREGPAPIRCTADRTDNNVDNGIQDGVIAVQIVSVSDGKVFDLTLSEPTPGETVGDGVLGATFSPTPGVFQTTIQVIAVDRQGKAPVPGTEIRFGLIDSPKVPGSAAFAIAGPDGDPQESGTLFTAPTGQFTTAGGGAGPGDTLVVFGKFVPGNRDLESARTIATINSATSLNVAYRFNPNDDTGNSVNNGPVLPYVIGRATLGNITAVGFTNADGVATATMTYPASTVGTVAVVWAQAFGKVVNGIPKVVSDAGFFRFAGIAPATITATPETIPGNTTSNVEVCVKDATGAGIRQVIVNFQFTGLSGQGSINGTAGSGTIITGDNGCLTVPVTTSGVIANGGVVTFSALGASASVDIVINGLILQAVPNDFIGDGDHTVTLTLKDGSTNQPVNDVQIVVTCSAPSGTSLTVSSPPGITGAAPNGPGQTTSVISASGFKCGSTAGTTPIAPSGTCTFTTNAGEPTAVVTFRSNIELGFSPPCEAAP